MKNRVKYYLGLNSFKLVQFQRVFWIAVFWTLADLLITGLNIYRHGDQTESLFLRTILVFLMSLVLAYALIFPLRHIFPRKAPWLNFISKAFILLAIAFLMNYLVQLFDILFIQKNGELSVGGLFKKLITDQDWILIRIIYWLCLFGVTQLFLQINDKYSPGVFFTLLMGKYIVPKEENRIVMFMDLKDSTPIAEKLGHHDYFLFIREFIYALSLALLDEGGVIYQYVGDEIVVSWPYSKRNTKSALNGIIGSRKNIQKRSPYFKRRFGIVPEFRVGIHVGDVTIGEIGVVKKDLAMSGDTMNTTARIRSACNEMGKSFIISKDFYQSSDLKEFQVEHLGPCDLKGKSSELELYSLKI